LPDSSSGARFNPAFATVTTLFFMWGFATVSIDPLVSSVRAVFNLTYAEAMLTQFAFFLAYGLISIPAAFVLERMGYARTILIALGVMILGCLLMPLATRLDVYALVLVALFVIAAGITQLQVAANPLAALLGRPQGAHFRLTLSQAFNSLGTVIAPLIASRIVLHGGVFASHAGADMRAVTLGNISTEFLIIASLIGLLAVFIWCLRRLLHVPQEELEATASPFAAFKSRWALFGALAIFLYVGAEVSIGSMLIAFLHQGTILGVSFERAGSMLSFYWGGAMVGRLLGSVVLIRVPASRALAFAAAVALLLCLFVTQAGGSIAGYAALAVGLFNAIMFPTIFSLTLERSHAPASSTSGLLCMAIVGGAILPVITGLTADHIGLSAAFFVPLASYACILVFALAGSRRASFA
jgi:FHS family L-fucose permease-like MFS transporter